MLSYFDGDSTMLLKKNSYKLSILSDNSHAARLCCRRLCKCDISAVRDNANVAISGQALIVNVYCQL